MLSYPVRLVPTQNGRVRASFPDVPEAVAEGADEDDALNRARYVLEMVLGHLVLHGSPIPAPSDPAGGPIVETLKFSLDPPQGELEPSGGEPAEGPIGGGRY